MRRSEYRAAWSGLLACTLISCSTLPWGPRPIGDCPGALRDTEEIAGGFTLRQRVLVTGAGLDIPLQLVVEKSGDRLVAIGFNPLGAKLFTLVQIGSEVSVDALGRTLLPVEPINVLRDLHRERTWTDAKSAEFDAVIQFDGVKDPGAPVLIRHPRCGYSISIETVSERISP